MKKSHHRQALQWRLADAEQLKALRESLLESLPLDKIGETSRHILFYDSFPWQLWFANRVLYREDDRLCLCRLGKTSIAEVIAEADISGPSPRFWWEFPDALAEQLKPLLKLRALMPVLHGYRISQQYAIRNEDRKIVARLSLETWHRDRRAGPVFLQALVTEPLRGYEAEFRALIRQLAAHRLKTTDISPLHAHFETSGQWPDPFSAKPALRLSPTQSSRDVLCTAIRASLQTARKCEPGILDDIDTEFLHDYRVSIRSIRAMLGQLCGVLPQETETRLKKAFADLGSRTNRLRDLDVYLLEEPRYRAMLPARLQDALSGMFEDFRKQRNAELKKLQRFLVSKTYTHRIQQIESWLEKASQETPTKPGGQPIIDIAHKRLRKQYRKVTKLGRELHQHTEDEAIHQLRLKCKKLRYLLELFASLFEPQAVKQLLKALRKLQNTLGEFNDLSVQQESLHDYYTQRRQPDPRLGLAIGALIGSMHQQQTIIRQQVVELFDHFDTRATRKLFDRLMHSEPASS